MDSTSNHARHKKVLRKQRMKKQIFDQSSPIINFNSISFLFSRLNGNYLTFWLLEIMTCASPLSQSADSFQHLSINNRNEAKSAVSCYYRNLFIQKWFVARNRTSLAPIASRDLWDFSKQTLVDKHLEKISLIASSIESACSSSPMSVTALRSDPIRIFFCAQRKQRRHQKKVKKFLSHYPSGRR